MAYEVGFVDNAGSEGVAHWQMLLKIKELAEANGWETMRYLNPVPYTDPAIRRELILKGEGLSGTEEIYVGFRTYQNQAADYYNLTVAGFIGYVPGNTFESQPGYVEMGVPAHNNHIDYWLIVNAQRIALGMKVGTPVYEHCYVGKFFPYATPSQYPYPLAVGGAFVGLQAIRFSDMTHSMYVKGRRTNFQMRFLDGTYKQPRVYPWSTDQAINTRYNYIAPFDFNSTTHVRDTGNAYVLLPAVLNDGSDGTGNLYGELDGIYHISGFNNAVENTLVIGGVTYVVLQDVTRTGFPDYLAMELS